MDPNITSSSEMIKSDILLHCIPSKPSCDDSDRLVSGYLRCHGWRPLFFLTLQPPSLSPLSCHIPFILPSPIFNPLTFLLRPGDHAG